MYFIMGLWLVTTFVTVLIINKWLIFSIRVILCLDMLVIFIVKFSSFVVPHWIIRQVFSAHIYKGKLYWRLFACWYSICKCLNTTSVVDTDIIDPGLIWHQVHVVFNNTQNREQIGKLLAYMYCPSYNLD
jgi:hypothetical protein